MTKVEGKSRILIIKTHAIGDLLMTTPAIRDIRKAYPEARITLMVGKWSAPAIRANPHIDEFLEVDDAVFLGRRDWGAIFKLLIKVRRMRFDQAFVFHPLAAVHLFARLAGIPRRYGITNANGSRHLTAGVEEDLSEGAYYPDNFLRVVALAGVPTEKPTLEVHEEIEDSLAADRLLGEAGVNQGEDFILVAPGGGRNSKEDVSAKRWPAEYFAEVVRSIGVSHLGVRVLLIGAESDRAETEKVWAVSPHAVDLTGKTSIRTLFNLARRARAVLSNDTALLHVAVACGTPVVAPFGPTSLARFLPPAMRRFSVQATIGCSPCYIGGRFPGCTIGHRCMVDIPPSTVVEKLESILEGSRAATAAT